MKTIEINGKYKALLKKIGIEKPLSVSYRASNDNGRTYWMYGNKEEIEAEMLQRNFIGDEYENSELYEITEYRNLKNPENTHYLLEIMMQYPISIDFKAKRIRIMKEEYIEGYLFKDYESMINSILGVLIAFEKEVM